MIIKIGFTQGDVSTTQERPRLRWGRVKAGVYALPVSESTYVVLQLHEFEDTEDENGNRGDPLGTPGVRAIKVRRWSVGDVTEMALQHGDVPEAREWRDSLREAKLWAEEHYFTKWIEENLG